jgi:hypothetical protein
MLRALALPAAAEWRSLATSGVGPTRSWPGEASSTFVRQARGCDQNKIFGIREQIWLGVFMGMAVGEPKVSVNLISPVKTY